MRSAVRGVRWFLAVVAVAAGCREPEVERITEEAPVVMVERLRFADTWLSQESAGSVQVHNPNRLGRRLTLAPLEPPFFSLEAVDLGPGETVEVPVWFRPTEAVTSTATLRLLDASFPALEVSLTGTGVAWPECAPPSACEVAHFSLADGRCVSAAAPDGSDCASSAPCLVTAGCQQGRCVAVADTCDDGDACTIDACGPSGCVRAPLACPAPQDPCRASRCDSAQGCVDDPVPDGTACGVSDCVRAKVCIAGACVWRPVPRPPSCTEWELEAYIKASNTGAGDAFGAALALSADGATLAVGAPLEDSVNAALPPDNSVLESGAVYVYRRQGIFWSLQAFLKATHTGVQDRFGASLALSADGATLVVGAPGEDSAARGVGGDELSNAARGSGAVYVFTRSGAAWSKTAYLKSSNSEANDAFGTSVAVSAAGDVVAVGAPGEDAAATGVGGDESSNAAQDSGAAYVFTLTSGAWVQEGYLKASNTGAGDRLGSALALSPDGLTLAAGAPGEASAGALGDDSRAGAGAVYVYRRPSAGVAFGSPAYVKAASPAAGARFGQALALSAVLAVGAPGEASGAGAVRVFGPAPGWAEVAVVRPDQPSAQDGFGAAVALSGDGATLAVGAPQDGALAAPLDGAAPGSGAGYVFVRSGDAFVQARWLKAGTPRPQDAFGGTVALSSDGATLGIGAAGESSGAVGVDGDESNDEAASSGAVYVF